MKFIDTHSHLYVEEFDADRAEAVQRAVDVGISHLYMPNIDDKSLVSLLQMVYDYPEYISPMIGLHPTEVGTDYLSKLEAMKALLQPGHPFVGIGEVGMDLYWDKTFRKEQMEAFSLQTAWAVQQHLPVIIHSRKAFDETISIIKEHYVPGLKGIFHSFTSSIEEARKMLAFNNFYLGINGVVTFKKAKISEVLTHIPLERIVLETDCPYLTPEPYRGRRNESSYLIYTLKKVAEVYGCTPERVAEVTTANAEKIFENS
jgi:TatD DNase family protein